MQDNTLVTVALIVGALILLPRLSEASPAPMGAASATSTEADFQRLLASGATDVFT